MEGFGQRGELKERRAELETKIEAAKHVPAEAVRGLVSVAGCVRSCVPN